MIKKTIVASSLVGMLLVNIVSTTVFAETPNKAPEYTGNDQNTITRELTPEERSAAKKKEAEVESYLKSKKEQGSDGGVEAQAWSALAVPHHKQIETHWCGPASSLAVIDYLVDSTPSQAQLADVWDPNNNKYGMNTDLYNGTTSPDMARSINHWIGSSWYVAVSEDSKDNLWNKIVFATDYKHPANLLVNTKHLSWYNGKELSHFITARGYNDNYNYEGKKTLYLVDPHYSDTYSGYHENEPFNNVYNAVADQSWRENVVY
ncbi:C39 family peptidase [Gracilibacillus sp. YIM 98692]|uniref:C39 family peptidase n=1 Tax=Gracilibacillus sp. YIM 98692 TaxID=2663532 RepID=UPI0013D437B0|nr:C39 family peptidase [Gracilibacillus sp. YIM 98692]